MKEWLEGIGFILVMWMIVSAGMGEIAGTAGLLWGGIITGAVVLAVYIFNQRK